ncbi:hypothetical protein QYS48_27235 [Marivirga arenosa]|uniref:Uncharacterized protein n=1 Tax=Marivirga arenosa TaxID=3059076 RepID=A0AA49GFY5_9BACT|nr:hypothetical protein [Marivirga sp. ABR2-2]WKK85521.2 hypothetical protein QYS48_27235 [Marivirga sp. ABR2-2]
MRKYFFLLSVCFLNACGTGEPISGVTKHIFQNKTNYEVLVIGYNDGSEAASFNLQSEEEYIWDIPARDGADNGPFSTSLFRPHDSVLVFYADTLVIHFDIGRLEGNPMRIENYDLVEGEREPFIYEFIFDEEDYNLALERGRIMKP